MYNWITLLYSRNYHNLVNQPYFDKIKKEEEEEDRVCPCAHQGIMCSCGHPPSLPCPSSSSTVAAGVKESALWAQQASGRSIPRQSFSNNAASWPGYWRPCNNSVHWIKLLLHASQNLWRHKQAEGPAKWCMAVIRFACPYTGSSWAFEGNRNGRVTEALCARLCKCTRYGWESLVERIALSLRLGGTFAIQNAK